MLRALLVSTLLTSPAWANIPAAYLACADKAEGDACRMVGPQFGACVRDALCTDNPDDDVDECVLCVDACWAREDGDSCLQTATNAPGVCMLQDRCTDKAETSFQECNRCVDGDLERTEPEDGCVAAVGIESAVPWALILLIALWQVRTTIGRRRARRG